MKYSQRKALWAGYIGMSVFGIAFLVMGSILPALKAALNLDNVAAAALVAFQPIGILVGSLIFGPITDRMGYKFLLVSALVLVTLGLFGLAYSQNMAVLRLTVFMMGLGGGVLNGATTALASDCSTDDRRGTNLNLLGVFYGVGAIAIPLLMGVMQGIPYQKILLIFGLVMCMAPVYFLFTEFPKAKSGDTGSWLRSLSYLKNPLMILFCLVLFCQSALEGLAQNWTAAYYNDLGLATEQTATLSLTFLVVGITAGRLLMGGLLLKVKARKALVVSMLVLLAGFAFLLSVPRLHPVAATLIIGLGLAPTFPVICSYVGLMYKECSGTAFSMALVIALIGNIMLNWLRGYVPSVGFPYYLLGIAGVMLALFLMSRNQIIKQIEKK